MILLEKNHVIYSGLTRELNTAAEEVPRVSLTLKRCFMNNLRGYRSRLGVQNNIHGHPKYPHRCNYYLLLRSFLPSTFADLLQRLQKRGIPLSSPIKSQLWSRCGSDLTSKNTSSMRRELLAWEFNGGGREKFQDKEGSLCIPVASSKHRQRPLCNVLLRLLKWPSQISTFAHTPLPFFNPRMAE